MANLAAEPISAKGSSPQTGSSGGGDKTSSSPTTATNNNAVPNLLLKLLEACARHKKKHHDRDKNRNNESSTTTNDNNEGEADWCHRELIAFARVLPRMESTTAVRNTHCDEYHCFGNVNDSSIMEGLSLSLKRVHDKALEQMDDDEDAVGHLCALYRAIARGSFCSHAFHFLFVRSSDNNTTGRDGKLVATDIDIANGILPRISKLLQYLAMDPMRVAFSPLPQQPLNKGTSTVEEAVKIYNGEEDLGATIAVLLNLLQDDHLRLAAAYMI